MNVEFEFSREWVHAGQSYKAGDMVVLTPGVAEKLMALGAGSAVERESKPQSPRKN